MFKVVVRSSFYFYISHSRTHEYPQRIFSMLFDLDNINSVPGDLTHHALKEHFTSVGHCPHVCHPQQNPMFAKERGTLHGANRTNSTTSLPMSSRCGGSLDRRRRKLRSRVDRDQRAMSHSDLICQERDKPHHYCSLQQFHCGSNACMNNYHSKTEVYLCTNELSINFPNCVCVMNNSLTPVLTANV